MRASSALRDLGYALLPPMREDPFLRSSLVSGPEITPNLAAQRLGIGALRLFSLWSSGLIQWGRFWYDHLSALNRIPGSTPTRALDPALLLICPLRSCSPSGPFRGLEYNYSINGLKSLLPMWVTGTRPVGETIRTSQVLAWPQLGDRSQFSSREIHPATSVEAAEVAAHRAEAPFHRGSSPNIWDIPCKLAGAIGPHGRTSAKIS